MQFRQAQGRKGLSQFENKGDGFEHHINVDHNIWNYFFFLYSVKRKEPTEYNGIESYVREKLDNLEVSWIPVMRASVIPDEDETNNQLDKQIEQLARKMDGIKLKLKSIN